MAMKSSETKNRVAGSDRVLMKDQAYHRLKSIIQSSDLGHDGALSERQLSAQLGMSKTPIRAALEILESRGLVTVSPQKGILVRELTAREISELFDVRFAVEPFIVKKLARKSPTRELIDRLKKNLADQKTAARKGDPLLSTELDIEFHQQLATMVGNREFLQLLERCFDRLYRSILHVNRSAPDRLEASYAEHEEIVQEILSGDFQKSAALMVRHLKFGRRYLLGGGEEL
jgi:DNA-binding GntR family transcriptional regulator